MWFAGRTAHKWRRGRGAGVNMPTRTRDACPAPGARAHYRDSATTICSIRRLMMPIEYQLMGDPECLATSRMLLPLTVLWPRPLLRVPFTRITNYNTRVDL